MSLYEQNEDYEADDPGNVLRKALEEQVKREPPINERALIELLYTARERYLTDDVRIDPDLALTIWRIVEISRQSNAADIAKMRM